jgi:putative ABC transport system permease protein
VFLSQGMAVVTARLLGAGVGSFRFIFSFDALVKTAGYFGLAFALVLLFNIGMLGRWKLIDLLGAAKKNEAFKAPRPVLSVLLFVLSLCCLGLAYKSVMANSLIASRGTLTAGIVLGVFGTFLFFFSLSGFFLKLTQQSKRVYLKGLNMFILRQISSRINTAYVTMTFVCLMLFISICTLSVGMGLSEAISAELRENTPFDATFSVRVADGAADDAYPGVDLAAAARGRGIGPCLGAYAAVRRYGADTPVVLRADGAEASFLPEFMKLSDYNALLALQGAAPISLGEDEYAFNSNMRADGWQEMLAAYTDGGELELAGRRLRAADPGLYAYATEVVTEKRYEITAIVQDALLADAPVKQDLLHVNYPSDDGAYETLCVSALLGFTPDGPAGLNLEGRLETKTRVKEYSNSSATTVAYLAIYLGVVSLLMAATAPAIGQLSEAGDNMDRYGLLRKIGAEDRMIDAALFTQMLICFAVPALPALLHAAVGIRVASNIVQVFGEMNILGSSLVAAFVIVAIYCVYFFATYFGSKRIVNKEYAYQRRITE